MSAIRLREFGRAIAFLPEDRTTWKRWTELLGNEIDSAATFIAKKGTARALSLSDAAGVETRYRIVAHTKTDLVGVDDETGERISLTFDEAQLHAVDWSRVVSALKAGLNLSGPHRAIPDFVLTWELGRCALTDEVSAPIYLVAAPRDRLAAMLDRLAATGLERAVVLVGDAAAVNPEACARLSGREIFVTGIADKIAVDDQRRLVGIAGPESVIGDLRALLGLAPLARPDFQMVRSGARWDVVFRNQDVSVGESGGMGAIAQLLEKPNEPIPATTIQAAIHRVERRLLAGSKGPKNDRETRDAIRVRVKELFERMQRIEKDHQDYDRDEAEFDRLTEGMKDGDGLGGADVQLTVAAAAGRAVGNAINRAIETISKEGQPGAELAVYLKDTLKGRTGQNPCYRPADPAPIWVIAM